jgi:hypothetical protein
VTAVYVQYDVDRYPESCARLIRTLDRLDAECDYVIVDNRRSGSWSHLVSKRLVHVGGDNSAWEFSAFDRGLEYVRERGSHPEVVVLATDALLAYGDAYLDLVDNETVAWTRGRAAGVGWIDSFMQACEILGHRYDSWLRTSLVFLPWTQAVSLGRLAIELDERRFFSGDPEHPFLPDAPLSGNLQELLLQWLTTGPGAGGNDGGGWHSRFVLDAGCLGYFQDKVQAILREHLLGARLRELGVPAFDLRAVRELSRRRLGSGIDEPTLRRWQWLGWIDEIGELPPSGSPAAPAGVAADELEQAPADGVHASGSIVLARSPATRFILTLANGADHESRTVTGFAKGVLDLVRQRHPDVAMLDSGDSPLRTAEKAVAAFVPTAGRSTPTMIRDLCRSGSALIGPTSAFVGFPAVEGRDYLAASATWEYAAACCKLIEEPALARRLGERALRLGSAIDSLREPFGPASSSKARET